MKSLDNINPSTVNFFPIEENLNGELYKEPYVECSFCEKLFKITTDHRNLSDQLSSKVYCNFCIRHGYQTKAKKNILMLTFRGIVGHYYYYHYKKNKSLWVSEIKDYIDAHVRAGMESPFFNYDPETLLWFVDFSRIGMSAKKVNKDIAVLAVVSNIISTFDIENNVNCKSNKVYEKYVDAINLFYSHRKRPPGKKILNPTLGRVSRKNYNIDKVKNFISKDLKCC